VPTIDRLAIDRSINDRDPDLVLGGGLFGRFNFLCIHPYFYFYVTDFFYYSLEPTVDFFNFALDFFMNNILQKVVSPERNISILFHPEFQTPL
jgi:hypothetical protein